LDRSSLTRVRTDAEIEACDLARSLISLASVLMALGASMVMASTSCGVGSLNGILFAICPT
jgi:hypothetical protein